MFDNVGWRNFWWEFRCDWKLESLHQDPEADDIPALLAKLKVMVPELLELNDGGEGHREVPLELLASQQTSVCV